MNGKERAKQLVQELSSMLDELEMLEALVPAAHVDVAIDTLCKEFNIERLGSIPD